MLWVCATATFCIGCQNTFLSICKFLDLNDTGKMSWRKCRQCLLSSWGCADLILFSFLTFLIFSRNKLCIYFFLMHLLHMHKLFRLHNQRLFLACILDVQKVNQSSPASQVAKNPGGEVATGRTGRLLWSSAFRLLAVHSYFSYITGWHWREQLRNLPA